MSAGATRMDFHGFVNIISEKQWKRASGERSKWLQITKPRCKPAGLIEMSKRNLRCGMQLGTFRFCHALIDTNSDYVILEDGKTVLCEPCVDKLLSSRPSDDEKDTMGRFKPGGKEHVTRRSAKGHFGITKTVAA